MSDPKGFLKIKRQECECRLVCERIKDYSEVTKPRLTTVTREQATRCMDCGTPFCHSGCPIWNFIPEWNDYTASGQWKPAFELLAATNNLPEVTGRVCPAPCEFACVLGINDDPITIRENELAIIEYAFQKGLIRPNPPKVRTGKKVAIIGSGPAGLTAASELNRMGHAATVFEKDPKIGGIMRYGIPDFKLEKWILDRRIKIWEAEGIKFRTGINAGSDIKASQLIKDFDAVCLSGGSRVPRDLKILGRNLAGIHFAMDYLIASNQAVSEDQKLPRDLNADGKKVVVIGGGDTGSDCVGCANRQGAACVVQIELLEKPEDRRPEDQPWPVYPKIFKLTSSHEEGVEQKWMVATKEFVGENGRVKKMICEDAATKEQFEIEADLVILAMGFLHPEHNQLLKDLKVKFDKRGNVLTDDNYRTSNKKVFAAGDLRRGQSLIVWAIAEGRGAAEAIRQNLGFNIRFNIK